MCAGGAAGCKARAETGTEKTGADTGAAPAGRHMTQSSAWACMPEGSPSAESPAESDTNLTLPAVVQISVKACGLTTGAATATPMDNANHTNIQRTMVRASRRDWRETMEQDYEPA